MKFRSTVLTHSLVIGLLASAIPAHAAIVANFTGGSGTTSVDQYTGIAGNGWTSGWGVQNDPSAISVTNANPINGSDNYLTISPGSTTGNASIGRAFDGSGLSGGVNANQPVVFNFDLRLDSLSGFGTANDYISLHASTGAGNYTVSANSSFIIRGYGASPATGKNANEWLFYDGDGDSGSFSVNKFTSSGMAMTANTTYHFTITNYHSSKEYDLTISNGTDTVSFTKIGWRANNDTGLQTNIGFNNRQDNVADTFGYSLDNISIVPEPSIALLGGLGLLGLLRRRRD